MVKASQVTNAEFHRWRPPEHPLDVKSNMETFFFPFFKLIYFYVCMDARGESPEARVTGSCGLPNLGAGNQTVIP
jgi:hypothetical protein